jgi:poly(hydroxyalkanoate) granule-associated protein
MTTRKKSTADEMRSEIKANASKVWLAGLGALATAEEEGGKLFRGLVKKGETYEKKGKVQFDALKEKVETLAGAARERIGDLGETVKDRAEGAWEKVGEKVGETAGAVEERWDDKVHGVLRRIGVPSRNEIASLTRRVEELTAMVGRKAKPAARKPAPARKAAKKATKKSTATRRKK